MNQELRDMAEIALKIARADIEREGGVEPVIVVRKADGAIEQFPTGPVLAELMNNGAAKEIIFGAIRQAVAERGYTAVIIATEAWIGKTTPKGAELARTNRAEFLKLGRESGFKTAIRRGLMERLEAVIVTVQTSERCMIVQQPFERLTRAIRWREADVQEFAQDEFDGRMKMYGEPKIS